MKKAEFDALLQEVSDTMQVSVFKLPARPKRMTAEQREVWRRLEDIHEDYEGDFYDATCEACQQMHGGSVAYGHELIKDYLNGKYSKVVRVYTVSYMSRDRQNSFGVSFMLFPFGTAILAGYPELADWKKLTLKPKFIAPPLRGYKVDATESAWMFREELPSLANAKWIGGGGELMKAAKAILKRYDTAFRNLASR